MATSIAYDKITEVLIESLSEGKIPWQKPWAAVPPMNAFTKKAYRGINQIVLGLSKFADPRWATFKQITEHGGKVKKGSKSSTVVFWAFLKSKPDPNKKPGEVSSAERSVPFLKYFSVFNVEQTEGLDLPPVTELGLKIHSPIEACEEIVAGYENGPKINRSVDGAYYQPSHDFVGMPGIETFATPESYYSVLFHELGHSTGHATRLNRKEVANREGGFGSCEYSKEELVAEFTAYFLCNVAGIENKSLETNTTAYLQSWISALSGDVKLAVAAAGRAQKAADWIQGIKQEEGADVEVEAAQELVAA